MTLTHIQTFEAHEAQSRVGQPRRAVDCTRRIGIPENEESPDLSLSPELTQDYELFKARFDAAIGGLSTRHAELQGVTFLITHHEPNVRSILVPKHPVRGSGAIIFQAFVISFVELDDSKIEVRQHEVERKEEKGRIVYEFTTPEAPVSYRDQEEVLRINLADVA